MSKKNEKLDSIYRDYFTGHSTNVPFEWSKSFPVHIYNEYRVNYRFRWSWIQKAVIKSSISRTNNVSWNFLFFKGHFSHLKKWYSLYCLRPFSDLYEDYRIREISLKYQKLFKSNPTFFFSPWKTFFSETWNIIFNLPTLSLFCHAICVSTPRSSIFMTKICSGFKRVYWTHSNSSFPFLCQVHHHNYLHLSELIQLASRGGRGRVG